MSPPNQSFYPPLSSGMGLIRRVEDCPESVSVCSDDDLCKLVGLAEADGSSWEHHVLGELLCRLWLYRGDMKSLVEAKEKLSETLQADKLCESFARRFQGYRQNPKRLSEEEKGEIINDTSYAGFGVAWSFAARRMVAFLNCDGIIPVTANKMGVAIPFTVSFERYKREFRGWDNHKVDGWIKRADGLWESLGYGMGIQLGCSFGPYLEHFVGKSLVSGDSFGLPVLYAGTCHRSRELPHPLHVICTGRVADRKIYAVGEIEEKRTLAAGKLQAKLFVSPGCQDGQEAIGTTTHLQVREDTPCRAALEMIIRQVAGNFDPTSLLSEIFDPRQHEFSQVIKEDQEFFSGRETQLRFMKSWLLEKLGQHQPACRFIFGEAGCGKSAFMAKLAGEVRGDLGLTASFFFFGKSESGRYLDVATSLAKQLAEYSGYEWELVSREPDPLEQFKQVLTCAARQKEEGGDVPIFIVDGLDEAESKDLKQLLNAMKVAEQCIWILSGQPHLLDSIQAEVHQVELFSLPKMTNPEMTEFLDKAAPELSREIKEAIVEKSAGLPLYTKFVLDVKANGGVITLEDLPPFDTYLFVLLSRLIRPTGLTDAAWRILMMPILAILAASRSRGALSERMIVSVLARMGHTAPPENVDRALHCMGAIVSARKPENDQAADGDGIIWKLRHDQYRQFLLKDTNFEHLRTAAGTALISICQEWDNSSLSGAEKNYAAWFHIPELLASEKFDEVIDLAKSETFIEFQKARVGLSKTLDTMELGVELAYDQRRLSDAILLAIHRAEWAGREYSGSPLDALRERNEDRALEMVARLENQDDRTLWHLTLAAYHAVGRRYLDAARILDEHLPEGALREKLTGGTSLCAAALLCLLIPVRTNRFRWGWFLSRLTDESKELAAETLIRMNDPESAWAMIGAIKSASRRDSARISVVRQLATTDVNLAERQLHRFVDDINREWAYQEIVASYARHGDWSSVNRMLGNLTLPRQRSKALGIVSAELFRYNQKRESERAYNDALDVIEDRDLALKPRDQSQAYAEFAMTQAEGGFHKEALKRFDQALKILKNARTTSSKKQKREITRTQQAVAYAAIIACLCKTARLGNDYMRLLEEALKLGIEALEDTKSPGFRDRTRLRILLHLGSSGYHEHTDDLIWKFERRETKKRGAALLSALRLRFNPYISAVEDLLRDTRGHEERLEIAGRSALELAASEFPSRAVKLIGLTIFSPRESSAWRWGLPRLKAFTGFLVEKQHADTDEAVNQAISDLERNFNRTKSKIGWHLANFAEAAFDSGRTAEGERALTEARLEKRLPGFEESRVMLKANLERLEIEQGIKTLVQQEVEGIFPAVWTNRNHDLRHSFGLFRHMIEAFALSRRTSELDQICEFILHRVKGGRFFEDPRDRSRWAGEFAAQLAASAGVVPSLENRIGQFLEICTLNSKEPKNPVEIPDTALRAEAVMLSRTDFENAFQKALRIGDGEQMSKAFRDIALDAVRAGQCLRVQDLCQSHLMVHGRSEHLAEISECLAKFGDSSNDDARLVMRRLLVACSDFPDSAYRVAASLIRFLKPGHEGAEKIFTAIEELDRRRSSNGGRGTQEGP